MGMSLGSGAGTDGQSNLEDNPSVPVILISYRQRLAEYGSVTPG